MFSRTNPQFKVSFSAWPVLLGAFFYALTFLIYYPPIYIFRDEAIYLAGAYILRSGTIYADLFIMPNSYFLPVLNHWVPIYSFGNYLAIMPFTFLGWKACFLMGVCWHLLGTFVFVRLLKIFGNPEPFWGVLYLFFPGFVLFSRTLMSDIPSMVLVLLGVYFYYAPKRNLVLSGIFWGFSLAFRVTNAVVMLPFLSWILIKAISRKKIRPLAEVSLGIALFLGLMLTQNYFAYGSPFLFGLSAHFSGVENFSLRYFSENARHYFTGLMLVYPLMIFAFFLPKGIRTFSAWWAACFLLQGCYSLYYFHDRFPGQWITILFGNRYLFPVLPFLLLSYAHALQFLTMRMPGLFRRIFLTFLLGILVVSNIAIQKKHQQALYDQLELKNMIYENTKKDSVLIHDYNSAELLQKKWGARKYIYGLPKNFMGILSDQPSSEGVFLVTRDLPSGKPGTESELKPFLSKANEAWDIFLLVEGKGLKVFELRRKLKNE